MIFESKMNFTINNNRYSTFYRMAYTWIKYQPMNEWILFCDIPRDLFKHIFSILELKPGNKFNQVLINNDYTKFKLLK